MREYTDQEEGASVLEVLWLTDLRKALLILIFLCDTEQA